METCFQSTSNLHFDEVYISDLLILKEIFMQKKNVKVINEDFGLPFLLAKKENVIMAFACLMVNDLNQVDFVIFEAKDLDTEEKEVFRMYAEDCFKKAASDNYRDPQQLKSTISRIINWINV